MLPAPALIQVDGVRVRYGDRPALDNLSFEVRRRDGRPARPNGAGKTTTLSVLATLRRPDAGAPGRRLDASGRPACAAVLGFVPQTLAIYPTLTARENVRCFAGLFRLGATCRRRPAASALVGLADRADDVVATFSGGMQRR